MLTYHTFTNIIAGFMFGIIMVSPLNAASSEKDLIVQSYWLYTNMEQGGMNVHTFNNKMDWKTTLPKLVAIDDVRYKSDKSVLYPQVFQEIVSSPPFLHLNETDQRKFREEFERLKFHLAQNVEEGSEVKYDIQQLLSRIWSLSNNEILLSKVPSNALIFNKESAINLLISSISTNSAEGGGCYQGYAGRLALNYLHLLYCLTVN